MKKLNNYKRIWLILMMLSPFFSLVKAQTCDPLLLKTLSETRVTYFDKVTKGEKATITIKYPLKDTKYTVSDNDGNSKSFLYTSGTEEFVNIEMDEPVNSVRRYSLKIEKDGCSYQTGFNYTVTPETEMKIATRVEHEWCGSSGAIRFKVVGTGVNNNDFNFYIRKENESYNFATAKPHTGAISLVAGKYYVTTKRRSGSGPLPAESSMLEIKNDVKTIAYKVSQIPKLCGATKLGIRADINVDQWGNHAANYPVYYTLQDNHHNNIAGRVKQTSNIFENLDPGDYYVKVENFCGANPAPQPITLTDESFTFTHLYTPIAGKEFNCTKAQFDALYLYGTGIKKAVDSDAFNYPLTVKFTFTDPDGAVYTPTYVINNKTDLDTYLPKYYYGEALVVTSNFQEFNLPNKSGTWKIKADITMCGNTTSLAEVTSVLYNPIENAMVEVANDGTSPTACHTTQLRLRYKHRRDNSATLNTYLVIEQGPTRPSTDLFNYAGAGFSLMPATHSNPLLRGKYAKRILFSSWDFQTVVIPDYLRNGDTFKFRLVDDECNPSRYADLDPVTVTVPPTAVGVDIQVIASCEGATDIGAPNGSIRVERKNGAAVKKIEIIEYTDTANVVHTSGTIGGTSLSLPYTLTDNNRADENNWYVRDLPKGKYKFRITDVCNNITIPNHVPQIAGQTYNLDFAPGCEPVVVGYIDLEGTEDWRYNQSEFVIQHYKEDDQEWEEWAYAGLPYDTPINRKTTDEGLGKVGKFRIVRRIKNLNGGYECQTVIKERTFEGDLNGIQVVGFGCNDKKYHVMLTPEGGTAPFTYKLIHKLPAGSTTPDTSVAKTQPGDQFFINLDGSNVNNAYKFAITDACGKTVEKELTIANIQKPKIEPKPKRDYYCTGQEVKLTITDLGPNVQVEWYREDNPSTPLATGFSYTIPSLTATDFAKKYYVKIKIPSQHAIENCVTDEVDAFQFQESSVTVPPLARTNNGETLKCITGPTVFDVESLFNIPNSHLAANLPTGVTVRIREASGVIAVPNNHKINLRPRNGGQKPLGMGSYTFYYEVLSPCEKVITYQEAKLTVKELVDFVPKTTIKVCNANVTLDEIKQEIIKGSPKVTALQPDFTWYATESNANARTSPLAGSTSLSTPNGSSQDYWLRLTKNGYCTPEPPIKVTIKGETGVTAKNLGDVGCQLTTIASLKSLIDPSDAANVLIYRRGTTVPLADDALVDNNEQYDYAKNIYQCVTAPQQVNFTFTPRTTAKNEQVDVCFYIGYYGMRTTLTQIKTKLQERYPTGATFKFYSAPEAIPANEYTSLNREFIQSELFYFTVQEAGKCVSLPFSVRPGQNAMTEVETKTVTICEEITVGELIAKLQSPPFNYPNVKIHQGRGTNNMSDDTFVDWNNSIYFSAEEAGKCRSTKVPLIIKRNPNVTVATPKTFEVCKAVGQQPKVSDLKAVVGNDARIFVRDNNNRWVLQADTQNVYEANSYFYTIEEAGKCPSEKTALVVRITRKTTTPSAPTAGTFCTGATIAALKDYIDNTPQNVGTIRVYATNTDTTPITDATALTDNTTYYFSLQDTDPTKCESDRRALVVTLVAKPTVNLTYTYCAGTKLETLWNEIDASDSDDSLKFYETATSTTALARSAVLRAGNYYVAESSTTSALGNCETTRVPLAVVLTKVTAITADLSETEVNYCKGHTSPAALSVTAEGTGNFTYTWYKANNTTETGTVVRTQANVTANQDTYTPATDTVGTAYYYVVVKSSCGDDKASKRAKITIQSLPAITTQPATLSKPCKDSTLTLSIAHSGDGNRSVQWYRNTTNSNTGGIAISGETADTFIVPTGTVDTTYYYAVVSSNTGCTPAVSNVAEVIVQSLPAITTQPAALSKPCMGASLTLTIAHSGDGTRSVQWYRNITNSNTGGIAILGETADTFTVPTGTVGTTYYYAVVSSNTGCTPAVSNVAEVVVTAPTAIDTNLRTIEKKYCKDQTSGVLDLLIKAKGTAPFTYKWHKVDAATSVDTVVRTENTNSDEDSYTPVVTTLGTAYYYVEVSSACGSDVTSARAHITVTENTAIDTDLPTAEKKYCKDQTSGVSDLSIKAKGTAPFTYKWHKVDAATSVDTVVRTETDVLVDQDTYIPETTTVGSSYYYVEIHSDCGTDVTSARAKITITKPTAITTNLSTTEVKYCKDEPSPAALNVVVEGTGTLTYQWYKAADATSAGTQIAGQTTTTLAASAIEVATRGTTYYYVVVHSDCGTDVNSDRAKITITDPDTPIVDATQTFCNTATIADLRPNDSDIKWYASPTGGAPLTDGTGALAHGNKYYAARTLGSCESPRAEVTVNITTLTTPVVTEISTPACGQANVLTITTGFDTDATYTFVKEDDTPVSGGSVEGANHKITGLAPGKYKVKATKGACNLFSGVFEVKAAFIIPAKPEITLTPASCTSPTVAKLTQVSGLTFWHNGTQLTVNPITHEITGLAPGTYTITAKNNDNCESVASDSFEIKAQQTATTITTAPAGATYQKGAEATPLAVVATGEGTLRYKWYKNTDNNNTSGTEVGDNSPSYKPATDRVGTFYYWVEVTSNCGAVKSTVAEIKVVEGAPTIEANDDPDTTVRRGQEVAVLGNDKVNGNPATPADVDITISNDGGLTRVGVNPATGKIMIPNDAVPATYEITYKICVKNQPTICDEAKVKITVEVPTLALKAVDDDFGKIPNAVDYTTTNTVFSAGVDTMEGVVGNLSPERDVVLTPGAQPHENITMNPNGSITVKRGTPKGTYTYEYTICQKDVPTNCDTAKVSFEVIEAHIFAKDDGVWEVGTEGALTPSILNNDILGERVGIAPSEVSITKTNGKPVIDDTKMVMNEDGRISVKKNIPEGTYTYYYTITEKANISNTASAAVIIRVVSFSAQDDEFNITNDKTKEFKTESVLKNDELNKKKNPSPVDDVILTKGEAKDSERNPTNALTMNDDGTITIAPNTPDGVYTYTYTICKKSARTECKSAEAVIKLLPALIANDDDFTANPINPLVREGIAGNVLDNDRYANGNALEHLDKVKIETLDNQKTNVRIEQNGNVVIPQGAPAGEYTLAYRLCMKDHQICDDAKVKIVILEDKPIVIHNGISANGDGVNDGFIIEHIEGYPKNNLKIFNRWGVLVYEKDGYTNREPFDGHSNGRVTISAESKLPQGTYYYILEYQDTAEQTHTKKGWLYLKY